MPNTAPAYTFGSVTRPALVFDSTGHIILTPEAAAFAAAYGTKALYFGLPAGTPFPPVAPTLSAPTSAGGGVTSVLENAATGSTIGLTVVATNTGGPPVTYSLTDNNGGRFQINANTGVVTVANGGLLDYESTPGHAYNITVQATDGILTTSRTFSIGVGNVNEAPAGTSGTVTALEDTNRVFTAADFGFSDTQFDSSAPNLLAAVRITTLPAPGTGTLLNNGVAVSAGDFVSVASINAGHLVFIGAANANGAGSATFTFQVQDNGGTANGGVNLDPNAKTMTINVTAVNDAPTATNLTQLLVLNEDAAATQLFTAAPVLGDIDSANVTATLTLNASTGVLVGAGPALLAAGVLTYTITGTAAAVSTALAAVTYDSAPNFHGSASVGITVTDGANGPQGANPTGTVSITVNSVNDAPAGTDNIITASEDINRVFTSADFGFSDTSDSPANALAAVVITTLPTAGTLLNNGNPVVAGDTISAAAIAAGDLVFIGAADANGVDYASLTFQVRDNGGTANGGVDTDASANTMMIDVIAVNDAPTATGLTQSLTIGEDATATQLFTIAPAVGDIDSATVTATLTLDAAAGVLVGAGPGQLNTGVLTYTISGTAAAVNTALAAVTYDSADNFNGTTSVGINVTDGANGPQGTNPTGSVTITVDAVNDAPTATGLTQLHGIDEDAVPTALFGTAPVVADIDSANVTATLTLAEVAGVLVGAGTGVLASGIWTYTITGSPTAVNAALAAVTYDSAPNFNGTTTVGIAIDDGAIIGPQGANPVGSVDITVTAINDAPTATNLTQSLSIDEDDVATNLFALAPVVSDIDSASVNATLTLDPAAGFLDGAGPGQLIAGVLTYTISGDPAAVSAALAAVQFNSADDFNGIAEVHIVIDDGLVGPQGLPNPIGTGTVTINAINDAPTATNLNQSLIVSEDDPAATLFTLAPVVADIDSSNVTAMLTLDAAAGVLTGAGTGVLAAGVLTYTITGSAADVNTALAAVTYDSADNFNGPTSVGVTIDDGLVGPQNLPNPTGTISITVNAVNDAPTATNLSRTLTIDEDAAPTLLFGAALPTVSDIDSAVTATLTLDAAAGELTGAGAGVLNAGVRSYTISGDSATVSAALAAVEFDSADNFSGSTSVGVAISDGAIVGPQGGPNPTGTVDITVSEINDAPTLAATGNNPNYTPGGGVDLFSAVSASPVESGQLLTDLFLRVDGISGPDESLMIDGSRVDLVLNNVVFTADHGWVVVVNVNSPSPGQTTVGIATDGIDNATMEALIDGLTYTKDTVAAGELPRTITLIRVFDNGGSPPGTDVVDVSIASVVNFNAPPVVTAGDTVQYLENNAATVIDSTIAIVDTDDTHMESATVVISSGYAAGEDVLEFTNSGGITGNLVGNTLTATGTATLAQYVTFLESVTYRNTSNDPSAANRIVSYTVNDGTVSSTAATATIFVVPINDEPTLSATPAGLGFTENGAAVDLFSSPLASTVEAGQDLNQFTITVTNVAGTGATESLLIDGTTVALNTHTESTATPGMTAAVVLAGTTATVTVSLAAGFSAATMQTIVDNLAYDNTSEDPGALSRVVTITSLRDDGANGGVNGDDNINTTLAVSSTVAVTPVNDEPSLTTTGLNPGFTENGAAVDLFSTPVVASAIEAGQNLNNLFVTVSNVAGSGATESLFIDGTTVALTHGNTATTATNGMSVGVGLVIGVAAVQITKIGGVSAAIMQSIIDGLAYRNTSDDPGAATRVVTLTSLSDTGSNAPPNDNVAIFAIASSVAVTPVNDAPVVDLDSATGGTQTTATTATFSEGAGPPSTAVLVVPNLDLTDVDSANLTGATVTLTDYVGAQDVLTVSGNTSGTIGGVSYSVSSNVITFSGTASVAAYETAVKAVQYNNTSQNPADGDRHFNIQVTDGTNPSTTATATVNVVGQNDAPVNSGVPATQQTAFSETAFKISGISVGDVDAGAGSITTTLSASHGNITVVNAGATIGTNGTHSVTITGTVAAVQATLANNVTYQSDAYTGQDTFTVLTSDNGNTGTDPGLTGGAGNEQDSDSFNIAVVPQVWFIDNTPTGVDNTAPLGSQNNPFTTIDAFNQSSGPGPNDYVFLRAGTYTEADGINLKDGQTLVGQGETLQFANPFGGPDIVIETGSPVQTPVIVVTGNDNEGITLAQNNSIRGLDIGMNNATATGIEDGNGTVGNLTISNVGVGISQNLGSAIDIDQGGQLNVILDSVTSSGAARGIDLGTTTGLSGAGNGFTVSGTTTINDATSDGITIANSSLSATFTGKVTILNDAGGANGDGVDLSTNTGTYNFNGGLDITVNGTGAFGFRAQSSGTVGITDVGNTQITSNNGTALLINPTAFTATLDSLTSGGGAEGISLNGMSGALTIGTVSINGQSGDGIDLTSVTGNVTISGGTIGNSNDPDGIGVDINGGSGNIAIAASITKTTNGRVIEVTNHTGTASGGSTIAFSGAVSSTGNGDGIFLDNNDLTNGTTISFTNTLTLTTSASNSAGFTATNGGTVTATGTGSSINSGGGVGLTITDTTIGASDVIFHDISANGAANGIVLTNTGSSGGLTVTGDATSANNGSGGSIIGATGAGISLTSTRDVSLDQMTITNSANDGINGNTVTNFSFTNSTITGAGDGANEFGIFITNLFGTSTINNSSITNSQTNNLRILNSSSTAGTLNISNSTFTTTDAANGGDAVNVQTDNTGNLTVNLTDNNDLNNSQGDGIQASANQSSTLRITVDGSNSNYNGNLGSAVNIAASGSAQIFALVQDFGNRATNTGGVSTGTNGVNGLNVINIQNFDTSTINATVQNNVINGLGNNASGIRVIQEGHGTITAELDNNFINGMGANGILAIARASTVPGQGILNLTIHDNDIALTSATALDGMSITSGTSAGTDRNTVRLDLFDNDSSSNPAGQQGYRLATVNANQTFVLEDFTGNGNNAADVTAWVNNAPKSNVGSTNIVIGTPFGTIADVPEPSLPLLAAAGGVQASSPTPGESHLTQAQLDSAVAAAIAQWAHAGASAAQLAALATMTFTVADLAGNAVGEQSPGHVVIDTNAAGHGWFVDATPNDNFEFAHATNAAGTDLSADPASAAAGHLDLLTAVMHEMGHELGLDHAAGDTHDLMFGNLVDGERRLPDPADVALAGGSQMQPAAGQASLLPIIRGTSGNDIINAGHGGNILVGLGGADTFVFADVAVRGPTPPPLTHVADYRFAEGDRFDFSALTSAFHRSDISDANLVRVVEDPSGSFATLQFNKNAALRDFGPQWTNVARIDGAHAGDDVSVLLDSHGAVHLAHLHVGLLA